MSFLAPLAFWFAATLPVIVLFYLLKRRRQILRVPSTLLWHRYLAETQASAPFQRLRKNWLLLLQLLLLLLAIFAVARPFLPGRQAPSSLRVLILDASASMQSTDVAPSRFGVAQSEARRWIDGLKPGQRLIVLQAGPRTEVRQSASSDRTVLRRAVDACQVTDGPARIADALKLSESLIRDQDDAEIHLFSDGAIGSLEEFENHNLPLVYHRIGTRRNNIAITSLEVRVHPENPQQRAVFTSIANLSPDPVEATVELAFDTEVLDVRSVRLGPGDSQPLIFVVRQERDGVYTVRHTAPDDLPADNQASVASQVPGPVPILLVSRGNRFLEKALRAAGPVQLTVAASLPASTSDFGFVVLDDIRPDLWPEGNTLAIRAYAPDWFTPASDLRAPPIVDWRSTHPLLRFVSFDNVAIADATGIQPPSWGNVIVESSQGPLVVAGELGRRRIVWVGFDTLSSTWPLRVSFPMFIANAVDWLNPATARAERLNLRAGEPLRLDLPAHLEAPEIQVRPPGGDWTPLPPSPGSREIVFGATDLQGEYRLRVGTNETVFAVRALDLAESDSAPRSELPIGRFGGTPATTLRSANVEIWRWFAAAAFALLLAEWWVFHRRTA